MVKKIIHINRAGMIFLNVKKETDLYYFLEDDNKLEVYKIYKGINFREECTFPFTPDGIAEAISYLKEKNNYFMREIKDNKQIIETIKLELGKGV